MYGIVEIEGFVRRGTFAGRKVILVDPDTLVDRVTYEDLDEDEGERKALVTLDPQNTTWRSLGSPDGMNDGQVVMSHSRAIADMVKMILQGYRVQLIKRDILEAIEGVP